jgi:copper(I)-binding protein
MAINGMRAAHVRFFPLFLIAIFVFAPGSVSAQNSPISAGQLWAFPTRLPVPGNLTPPGAVDIYGAITNQNVVPDALVGISSPAGSKAQFVIWVRSFQLPNNLPLDLPGGKTVTLTSQTQFLRLTGGNANWKTGQSFPVILHFQHAPDAKVNVVVKAQ